VILLFFSVTLAACAGETDEVPAKPEAAATSSSAASAGAAPTARNAYFGDLHVHTKFSYDAFVFGTRTDPDDAYEFAKGNPISHPAGFELKLDRPLDFQGVSDHANYLGMLPAMMDETSPAYEHPAAETVRNAETVDERQSIFRALQPYVRFMEGSDPANRDALDLNVVRTAWQEVIDAANRHNDPGTFTTFIAYEYTSAGRGGIYNNLHRNVVFRGDRGPAAPFSRLDSYNPEDLWETMDGWRDSGIDALAIPHNMNGSGGRMFEFEYFNGGAIDSAYVAKRTRNEPIVEMTQNKGTSETHPALSPNDEWADFEIMPYRVSTSILSEPPGSYVRDAMRRGLTIESGGIDNPYKFGFIGSSDTHVSAGSFEEENFWGASGLMQANSDRRGSTPATSEWTGETVDDGSGRAYRPTTAITNGGSGLAGVWAEENTRESLFAAMRRKETFATSGTRIRIRFFAGDLEGIDLDGPDLASQAYQRGVPMGGDLAIGAEAPSFLVWALQDQLSQPLQRLQVVKGWIDEAGETSERVYDVVCSDGLAVDPATHRCPSNGATVDLTSCEPSSGSGAGELKTLWTDPDYAAGEKAFYYARVLENPVCRWSTWDALRAGIEPRRDVPPTIQERAWSSPIWLAP
jgi:hypothetical protein